MNILIMGLPGSGKGTQADYITKKYGIGHISTGDIFREVSKSSSPLATEIKFYIDNGNLVPDELTAKLLISEMEKEQYSKGFILDGFPRNINQAKILSEILEQENKKIDHVLFLDLDEDIIKERLVNRLVCPTCGSSYHQTKRKPKVDGVCDIDGTKLIQREDDKPEKIAHRLDVAREQTLPVVEYYKKEFDNVITIEIGENDSADIIFKQIEEKLQ